MATYGESWHVMVNLSRQGSAGIPNSLFGGTFRLLRGFEGQDKAQIQSVSRGCASGPKKIMPTELRQNWSETKGIKSQRCTASRTELRRTMKCPRNALNIDMPDMLWHSDIFGSRIMTYAISCFSISEF
eukprot:s223_g48.t1